MKIPFVATMLFSILAHTTTCQCWAESPVSPVSKNPSKSTATASKPMPRQPNRQIAPRPPVKLPVKAATTQRKAPATPGKTTKVNLTQSPTAQSQVKAMPSVIGTPTTSKKTVALQGYVNHRKHKHPFGSLLKEEFDSPIHPVTTDNKDF